MWGFRDWRIRIPVERACGRRGRAFGLARADRRRVAETSRIAHLV